MQDDLFWLGLVAVVGFGFIAPTAIGVIRNVEGLSVLILFNVLPMGWPAALVLAFALPRRTPAPIPCLPPPRVPPDAPATVGYPLPEAFGYRSLVDQDCSSRSVRRLRL